MTTMATRIPARYRSVAKKVSSIQQAQPFVIHSEDNATIDPAVRNRSTIKIPNIPGQFLDLSASYLEFEIENLTTSDDGAETYDVVQPGLASGQSFVTIDRIRLLSGSLEVDDQQDFRLQSQMLYNLRKNPVTDLVYQPYSSTNVQYQAGETESSFKKVRVYLGYVNSQLFGGGNNIYPETIDNFLLPAFAMPQLNLEIYWTQPSRCVSVAPGLVGNITPALRIRDLKMQCWYVKSDQLMSEFKQQGSTITFSSSLTSQVALPAGVSGNISVNLPSSFQSVSHLMTILQRPADDQDLPNVNRISYCTPEMSKIEQINTKINSVNRVQQPFEQSELQFHIMQIHPEATQSDYLHTDETTYITERNLIVFLLGRDVPDRAGGLLSGIQSSTATGSIQLLFRLADPLPSNTTARTFVVYNRSLQVAPDGQIRVSF